LDELARDPEHFEDGLRSLTTELDSAGVDLEITDPTTWHKPTAAVTTARVPLRQQFRSEVESMSIMDRESEARLARRIEFARMRLDRALEASGLSRSDPDRRRRTRLDEPRQRRSPGLLSARGCVPALARAPSDAQRDGRAQPLPRADQRRALLAHDGQPERPDPGRLRGAVPRVDGFDWKRGLLFRTYAVHWLNQAFRSHL
jgi:hypothetical protein